MKLTTNAQAMEAIKKDAIAPTRQSCIVEELSDEVQASVNGGWRFITATKPITAADYNKYAGFWGG
jgi:hypothetical protein